MRFTISVDHLKSIMDWVNDNQKTVGCNDTIQFMVDAPTRRMHCSQTCHEPDNFLYPEIERVHKLFFPNEDCEGRLS